jgi:prophage regulatory protein
MSQKLKQAILYITDVEQITGRNRVTLRRWWEKEKFPKPIKLHSSVLAWNATTIQAWISTHIPTKDLDSWTENLEHLEDKND